jgi:hypothetical protein
MKTELELQNDIKAAIESGDSEAFAQAQIALAKTVEARILTEARKAVNDNMSDASVLAKRGLNVLTTDERKYYMEVIGSGGFTGVEALVPATVFDRVFEDLRKSRPLLGAINFTNTTGVTEWISRNNDAEAAYSNGDLEHAINLIRTYICIAVGARFWTRFGTPPYQFERLAFWLEKGHRYKDAVDVLEYWRKVPNKANDQFGPTNGRRLQRCLQKAGTPGDRSTGDVVPFRLESGQGGLP